MVNDIHPVRHIDPLLIHEEQAEAERIRQMREKRKQARREKLHAQSALPS
jgi:hypothetical protein